MMQVNDWDDVKGMPQPRPVMEIGGGVWAMVDELELHNRRSEAEHAFAIRGAKQADVMPLRSKQRYADGTQVEDTGYWLTDGSYEFTLRGVAAGRPAVVLHRRDPLLKSYHVAVVVNGAHTGDVAYPAGEHSRCWQNWPIPIAAEHVRGAELRVQLISGTPGFPIRLFHVWVYQLR